jgi:uncharacterized sulfatase
MVVVRPLFFLEVSQRLGVDSSQFLTVLSGSLFDFLLVCRVMTYGLIPFLLIHWFFPKTVRGIFIGLITLYVVVSALLAEYYCNLGMPLDHVVLVYTPEELKTTVFASSSSISLTQVLWFVLLVGIPVLLMWLWRRVFVGKGFAWVMVVIALLTTLIVRYPQLIREECLYNNHNDFCLAVNQPSYAFVKINDYRKEMKHNADGDSYEYSAEAVEAYHALHPEFEYDHPGYPFYRKANDPDMLGPCLNPTSDGLPPNLVFIVVESLGRRLTGVTNPVLSFTPFIDSLATEGLFWPNCFSTSERTFGVLPSMFASAPSGRHGFTWHLPMPRHHSLLLDLERNGYTSSFYYGGDESFDHYDVFMEDNHIDYLFVPELLVDDSVQYKLLAENYRWGLDDDQLFDCAINHKKNTQETRPHADFYLTLTTHEPFVVNGIETYEQQVRTMVEQTPDLVEKERDNVLKNLNIYACFLYLDQCMRQLFDYYTSRPDFDNTIFVITGDHRMAPVLPGISLRYYNVPMIVYSPLVKQPKTMQAVVSHLDVTPSFNAYLHANYNYDIDDHCHWLGTSFDTVSSFRNTRKLAFMRNNRDVVDYLSDGYFINRNNLIKMDPSIIGYSLDNEKLYQQYKAELDDFELVSRFVVQHDVLMP